MNKKKSKALAFLLAASLLIPSANGIVSAAELDVNTDKVLEDSVVVDSNNLESDKVVESEKSGENWGDDYETATTFTINSLEELKSFRDLVNNGKNFKGKTVNLNSSIDLKSEEWTPIGSGSRISTIISGNSFRGIFNGNGNTISNLKITSGAENSLIGFFGGLSNATVKNINFENVDISSASENVGTVAGAVTGSSIISGINVKSGKLSASNAGGVIGRLMIEGTIESCTNAADITASTGGGSVAGIVSKAYYTRKDKEMNIINCTNTGTIEGKYAAGGIVGLSAANVKDCINNANITGPTSGGIIGEQLRYGTIESNTNKGNISGSNPVGGIVGWVRYNEKDTSYQLTDKITIKNNKNSGDVISKNNPDSLACAGGIVGNIYNAGYVYNNENTADKIEGTVFAAGIGTLQPEETNKFNGEEKNIEVYDNLSLTSPDNIKSEQNHNDTYVYNNIEGSQYVNLKNNVSEAVASSNGRNYASLEGAIQECENGETVTLLKDVEIDSPIKVEKKESIKIDFAGNEVKTSKGFNGDSLINIESSTDISLHNGNFVVGDENRKAIELKNSSASMNGDFNTTTDGKKEATTIEVNKDSVLDKTNLDSINGKEKDSLDKNDIVENGGTIVDNENSTPSYPSYPSKPTYTHEEIIGSDRYDTAAKIADKLGSYDNVVLVNAESSMSDGLSASGLAGKENGAILLTKKDSIPKVTMDRIKKVKKVYIIGGEAAISQKVYDEITKNVPNVKIERLGGKTRVETSEIVAKKLGNYSDAFVVNGFRGEADAMSASAIAAKKGAPILLTNGKTSTHAKKSGVEYYVIGGNSVVDKSIADKYNAEVLAGKDRYATNKEVINEFYSGSDKVYIANGDKLVDALTASPLAKNHGIVLVNEKSDKSILKGKDTVQVGGMDFKIEFEK